MRFFVFLTITIAANIGHAGSISFPVRWYDCFASFIPDEDLQRETQKRIESYKKGFTVGDIVVRPFVAGESFVLKSIMRDERFQKSAGLYFDAYELGAQLMTITMPDTELPWYSKIDLAMVGLKNDRVIGVISISTLAGAQSDIEFNSASVGYGLAYDYWGKGIMRDIFPKFLEHFFSTFPFRRLVAHTLETNVASIRLLQNNGFVRGRTSVPYQPDLFPGLMFIHWVLDNPEYPKRFP